MLDSRARRIRGAFGEAAGDQLDAQAAGQVGRPGDGGPARSSAWARRWVGVSGHREVLGQDDQFGTAGGGALDERRRGVEVLRAVRPGSRLDGGDPHATG